MIRNLCLVAVASVSCLFIAEIVSRLSGLKPFSYSPDSKWTLKVLAPDPLMGWKNKPGFYRHSFLPENGYPVLTTIHKDGSRLSTYHSDTNIWGEFYGGSMGFGWGVNDGKTAADLVSKYLRLNIKNLSVGGFGTLQVLMALERSASKWTISNKPEFIVYQFATHHWNRASGEPIWILSNEKNNPREGKLLGIPYARFDRQNQLKIFPAERYRPFPLREYSALISASEQHWVTFSRSVSLNEMVNITAELVRKMERIALSYKVPFVIAGIYSIKSDFKKLQTAVGPSGIIWAHCMHHGFPKDEFKVPNDGHPNSIVHAFYGKCISDAILKSGKIKLGVNQRT